jgi:hypothetical protein
MLQCAEKNKSLSRSFRDGDGIDGIKVANSVRLFYNNNNNNNNNNNGFLEYFSPP